MSLEIVRRIRGNVHGTIDVTALENAVIDHPYMQRLRRVRQLAFLHYVFPGATHTRFEHSLGVMQLAGIAWDKLRVNQQRLLDATEKIADFAAIEQEGLALTPSEKPLVHGLLAPSFAIMPKLFGSDYHLQVLRLAGLLHDIGHPPFSHSGERFMPSWREVWQANSGISDYLKSWIQLNMERLVARKKDPYKEPVRHEVFSLLLADALLKDIYRKKERFDIVVEPQDLLSVIVPEIEPASGSPLKEFNSHRVLNELISGELDIDRMDYLLRDSRECGVVYGVFDVSRILDGLCIYQNPEDQRYHVAMSYNGLTAFDDYLRARQSMYLQVYFHKTAAACEAMMKHLARSLDHWRFAASYQDYAEIDEYNIEEHLNNAVWQLGVSDSVKKDLVLFMRRLFRNRDLWKLALEYRYDTQKEPYHKLIEEAHQLLHHAGITSEHLSSVNSLTRFQPRIKTQTSDNYLRVIIKDAWGIPRVAPIEDYSRVIKDNETVVVQRIYVEGHQQDKVAKIMAQFRQQTLSHRRVF